MSIFSTVFYTHTPCLSIISIVYNTYPLCISVLANVMCTHTPCLWIDSCVLFSYILRISQIYIRRIAYTLSLRDDDIWNKGRTSCRRYCSISYKSSSYRISDNSSVVYSDTFIQAGSARLMTALPSSMPCHSIRRYPAARPSPNARPDAPHQATDAVTAKKIPPGRSSMGNLRGEIASPEPYEKIRRP